MSDKVKVGIIGLGSMGALHFKCYGRHENAEVVAVCDSDKSKLSGDWSGIGSNLEGAGAGTVDMEGIATYENYADLLKDESLDIVDVCLPTPFHAEVTIAALNSGHNVFCEKPMAMNDEECARVQEAQQASGKQLMIGHCLRYWPHYVKAKEIIDSGEYGRIRYARFHRSSGTPQWSWHNWYQQADMSGGCVFDMHIHDADAALWWLGKPATIEADGLLREDGLQMKVDALWHYDNGVVANLHGGWDDNGGEFRHAFHVEMERGTIALDSLGDIFEIRTKDGNTQLEASDELGHLFELHDYVDCIAAGRDVTRITPADSRLAVQTVREEMRQIAEKAKR